jgi:hypothetical protein
VTYLPPAVAYWVEKILFEEELWVAGLPVEALKA